MGSNVEIIHWFADIDLEGNKPYAVYGAQGLKAIKVVRTSGVWDDNVGAMRKKSVRDGLSECRDRLAGIRLYLSRNNLQVELNEIRLLRLENANHIRRSPFSPKRVPSDNCCLGNLFNFFQPFGERLIEITFAHHL